MVRGRHTKSDEGRRMKYIIDIPDEAIELMDGHIRVFVEPEFKTGDCKYYALRLSKENIEPYTEPDEDESYGVSRYKAIGLAFLKWLGNDAGDKLKSADDVYQFLDKNCCNKDAVEDEVWKFVRYMALKIGFEQKADCFGTGSPIVVVRDLSYQEAIANFY